jgi:hypothetical protein
MRTEIEYGIKQTPQQLIKAIVMYLINSEDFKITIGIVSSTQTLVISIKVATDKVGALLGRAENGFKVPTKTSIARIIKQGAFFSGIKVRDVSLTIEDRDATPQTEPKELVKVEG